MNCGAAQAGQQGHECCHAVSGDTRPHVSQGIGAAAGSGLLTGSPRRHRSARLLPGRDRSCETALGVDGEPRSGSPAGTGSDRSRRDQASLPRGPPEHRVKFTLSLPGAPPVGSRWAAPVTVLVLSTSREDCRSLACVHRPLASTSYCPRRALRGARGRDQPTGHPPGPNGGVPAIPFPSRHRRRLDLRFCALILDRASRNGLHKSRT